MIAGKLAEPGVEIPDDCGGVGAAGGEEGAGWIEGQARDAGEMTPQRVAIRPASVQIPQNDRLVLARRSETSRGSKGERADRLSMSEQPMGLSKRERGPHEHRPRCAARGERAGGTERNRVERVAVGSKPAHELTGVFGTLRGGTRGFQSLSRVGRALERFASTL